MKVEINASEITVPSVGLAEPTCCGCGKELGRDLHTVFDCLKELQRQIAELRGAK